MARVSFGTRLRSLRERAGLTHTELAVAVGVSQGNIATWERNAAVPEIAMVERLAVFLGVSLVELTEDGTASTGRVPGVFFVAVQRSRRAGQLLQE